MDKKEALKLKELLEEDEAVYALRIQTYPNQISYFIGPDVDDTDWLDIFACIEDTLHRVLGAGWGDSQIWETVSLRKGMAGEGDIDIDLGYILPNIGEYPGSVEPTYVKYVAPCDRYKVCYPYPAESGKWEYNQLSEDSGMAVISLKPYDECGDDDIMLPLLAQGFLNRREYAEGIVLDTDGDGKTIDIVLAGTDIVFVRLVREDTHE